MKFSINQPALLKALQTAYPAISSNAILPDMENFLLSLDGSLLEISAHNGEISIYTTVETDPLIEFEKGSASVTGRTLYELVKALPGQDLSFTSSEKSLEIQGRSSRYTIALSDPKLFPSLPAVEPKKQFTIDAPDFADGINKTAFSVSTEPMRINMHGILLQVRPDGFTFVATNDSSLPVLNISGASDQDADLLISKDAALVISKTIKDECRVSFDDRNVFFDCEGLGVTVRLIDAKFPDYKQVIPDNKLIFTFNRTEMLSALRRLSIADTAGLAKFEINSNGATLTATDIAFGNQGTETIGGDFKGKEFSICFNSGILSSSLSVFEQEEMEIRLDSPNRAGILAPVNQKEGQEFECIVMPVFLEKKG